MFVRRLKERLEIRKKAKENEGGVKSLNQEIQEKKIF